MQYKAEADFFKDITKKVLKLVADYDGKAEVAKYKEAVGDYATEVDVAVEQLIVSEIHKRFPGDGIMAEEEHAGSTIGDSRIWIIDPICGTTSLGRNIKTYCTNIALADKKELVAACVVDYSHEDYFWSVGGNKVYINDDLYESRTTHENFGIVIDMDLSVLPLLPKAAWRRHADALVRLYAEPGYSLQSLNSSLGFAYTAVGKIDGFINATNHPWDICAGSFLLQQAGGTITDPEGKSWKLDSLGAIGASNEVVHKKLLSAYSVH